MADFTIEELEALVERYDEGAEWTPIRIAANRKDIGSGRLDIFRQLLSALKENRALQAKIDAALAIEEEDLYQPTDYSEGYRDGANQKRAELRAKLLQTK